MNKFDRETRMHLFLKTMATFLYNFNGMKNEYLIVLQLSLNQQEELSLRTQIKKFDLTLHFTREETSLKSLRVK